MNHRITESKDLEAINNIMAVSFDRIYAYYAKKSFSSLKNALTAEEGPVITGAINYMILHSKNKKIGYLYYLAVHPDYRRKGVGKELILQAINRIKEKEGPIEVYAAVEKDNMLPRDLIKQIGFVPICRPDFKKKYGAGRFKLYIKMRLMFWEELFVLKA